MIALFRTRIAARSTALILLMTALTSLPLLAFLSARAERRESDRQQATLAQLLDTVERTAQIACFVGDTKLSEELAAGLLKNATVGQVTIYAGDRTLALQSRPGWTAGPGPMSREIHSPFDPTATVGRIVLLPDGAEIARQTDRQARSIRALLILQALVVTAASVLVVLFLVTRPITRLSRRLHRIQAETGETLTTLRGHESDEIGRLVGDVNALIDRLVTLIHAERALRDEIEAEHDRLEQTLAEVRTLQGLLPICAWCKKVRDDEGLWTQIEQYVTENTEARFTHGLCPECAKRQLAEFRDGKG